MLSVYDPITLKIICNIPKLESVQWTRRFYDAGSFEIYLSTTNPKLCELKKGRIIRYKGNAGIINYIQQTKDTFVICGSDLKGMLEQRITIPPFVYKETPEVIDGYDRTEGCFEEIMRHYVNMHTVNPTDTNRKIQRLVLNESSNLGNEGKWQSRFDNLLSELSEIGLYDEIGFDISLDTVNKNYVFSCSKGRDLTKTVTFAREFKNIGDFCYTVDALSEVNTTYVGGDGEEELQYIEKVSQDDYTGIHRKEDYITFVGEELDDIKDKGLAHLKEKELSETVEADANEKLKYKEKWDLGDYVTVKLSVLGETYITEKQITEVKEVYEHANVYAAPTLGNKKNSIIRKILKES